MTPDASACGVGLLNRTGRHLTCLPAKVELAGIEPASCFPSHGAMHKLPRRAESARPCFLTRFRNVTGVVDADRYRRVASLNQT